MPVEAVEQSSTSGVAAPEPPRRRRLKMRHVLVALVLLLIAAEIALRLYAALDSSFNIRLGALKETDPDRAARLRPNARVGPARINSRGILGPEFEVRKAPGACRIVTLGDSCSFIPVERNYPRVLEEILRDANPDRRIEVINASCPGYHSGQARQWYEQEIDGYEHDLLIIYVGWNDIGYFNPETRGWTPPDLDPSRGRSAASWIVEHCYLLRLPAALLTYRTQGGAVSLQPLTPLELRTYLVDWYPQQYDENLSAIIERARSRGRQVFLLNRATLVTDGPTENEMRRMHFPLGVGRNLPKFCALIERYDSALLAVAQRDHVPVIDIASLFATPADRAAFTDSSHFDAVGAERIARHVAEQIAPAVQVAWAGPPE